MARYTTFKCDVCKRTADRLSDTTRVSLSYCTITKGCSGSLQIIGDSDVFRNTPVDASVDDWYPRGTGRNTVTPLTDVVPVLLSNSASGTVTIAVNQTQAEAAARLSLRIVFTQRKIEPISFQEYLFVTSSPTNEVSGRDTSGRNMRVEPVLFTENRIKVRVNGVERSDISYLDPNKIKFDNLVDTASQISVIISAAPDTSDKELVFTRHSDQASTSNFGAWDNVKYISKEADTNNYWLYSCTDLSEISASSSAMVKQVMTFTGDVIESSVIFLLSSPPYESVDRYMQFFVDSNTLKEDFPISSPVSTVKQLQVGPQHLREDFPAFKLTHPVSGNFTNSSFIRAETIYTAASSAVTLDSSETRYTGKKILGPV